MTGQNLVTGSQGASKLLWKAAQHPTPKARVMDCKDTRCGTYRTYQQGRFWHAIYLPNPSHVSSIGIERSEAEAQRWAQDHHDKRRALADAGTAQSEASP